MRNILALAAASAVALFAFGTMASAEPSAERMQKAPTKTMGDEGKLPPTKSMSGEVPGPDGCAHGGEPSG